jgi:hypothetical protein
MPFIRTSPTSDSAHITQARRVGMWSGINPQCAAEFRREKRNAQ